MLKKILLASVGLFVIATPVMAKDKTKLGKGDYEFLIFPEKEVMALFPGDKAKDVPPVTTQDFDVANVLDKQCREQTAKQAPSMLKDVGLYTLRTAPFSVAGGYLGSMAGGFALKGSPISDLDYAKNAGIQMGFGAIGGAINASEMAKHYDIAGCMLGFTQIAQERGYLNRNIVITFNAHPARGHAVTRESFPSADGKPPVSAGETGRRGRRMRPPGQ